MSNIIDMINNVGFPIVCCVLMYYQNTKVLDKMNDSIKSNTIALNTLIEKLDNVKSDT